MISQIHHTLPASISKSIIKSMIGSLNATAIAYTRMHLRFGIKELPEVPSIDDFNDERAAVSEQIERDQITQEQGFNTAMPTPELIERLMGLREFFVQCLDSLKSDKNDVALTIAETVKFQMERTPDANDSLIEALAAAVDIDPAVLKAAQLKMITDDAADLKANAGKITDYLGQHIDHNLVYSDADVETCFNKLPAHVQYKLISAGIRAHDKAQQKAMISLLRGKIDAAGDIKLLQGHRTELVVWLVTFSKAKRIELDEYLDRGGMLPDLEDRTIVTSNTSNEKKAEMKAEPKHDLTSPTLDASAFIDPAKPNEPVSKGRMQRAPAPAKADA